MLSIIIPTYKERENLRELLERIAEALKGEEFEVLVVDDGSDDGTPELVEEMMGMGYSHLRLLRRPARLGLASAIIDGLRSIKGEMVAVMDADLQHPPELLPRLLKALKEGANLAIASRYAPGGKVLGWSVWRRGISKMALALAHLLLPSTRSVSDAVSGYFAFRRSFIELKDLSPLGFKLLTEMLVKGDWGGRIVEVPYAFTARARGRSKLGLLQMVAYLRHLWRLRHWRSARQLTSNR